MFSSLLTMGAAPVELWQNTTDLRGAALGQMCEFYDETFGYGELRYMSLATASTLATGTVVTWDDSFLLTAAASTAGLGRPLGVVKTKFTSVTGVSYGWVQIAGLVPATFSVAATVGALYLGTAGNFTPTAAAGKQVLNAYTIAAATKNFTRSITTRNGNAEIAVSSQNGIFPGLAISGTGVPGSTTILSMETTRRTTLTMSANATASGTVTGTFTYTGFGLVQLNRAFSQGQIT